MSNNQYIRSEIETSIAVKQSLLTDEQLLSAIERAADVDDVFKLVRCRGKSYPLFDIWGLSCENLLNNDEYRQYCRDNNLTTASGKYYPTNAEVAYKFLKGQDDFVESHTAIEDADIECEILAEIFKKVKPKNMTMGIIYFPFRMLGRADIEG